MEENIMKGNLAIKVNATELQNNFGKYLQLVSEGNEIIVLKNGNEIARFISKEKTVSFLTNSISGVIKDVNEKALKDERRNRYESAD